LLVGRRRHWVGSLLGRRRHCVQVAKQIHDIEADAANSESSLKAIQHHETFRTTHHTASIQFY
jgi:hypothetical protein